MQIFELLNKILWCYMFFNGFENLSTAVGRICKMILILTNFGSEEINPKLSRKHFVVKYFESYF